MFAPPSQRSSAPTSLWRTPAFWIAVAVAVATALWIMIAFLLLPPGLKESATGSRVENAMEALAPSPDNHAAPALAGPVTVPQPTNPRVAMPGAAAPIGLRVEAAGIEVAVLPLTPTVADNANQSIVPPLTEDGYWLTPYGTPGTGSDNTTYIVGHSWEGRDAPFDRLSTETEIGDTVVLTTTAGTINYVVDSVATHAKASLREAEIWDIVPNRLIIISCYTEDPWGKNVVVSASPAGS